jgi:PII-like signaling protein
MRQESQGFLLRIFIGDSDRAEGKPLYELLVERARTLGLAGATVLHGPMGFGRHSRLHTAKLVELSAGLPIVIELVDSEVAIQRYLGEVEPLIREGLVTLEKVRILTYRPSVPAEHV